MINVIDVFAGPGGLNEGFSRYQGASDSPVFKVAGSFEMDATAVETLALRAAARSVGLTEDPSYLRFLNAEIELPELLSHGEFQKAHQDASEHVHQITLGPDTRGISDEIIKQNVSGDDPWVLIGGPPCQAYSLAGRSKMKHRSDFLEDKRHFLFKEYLHILETHRPSVFVMENVKGLLSATHRETQMFDLIMSDLSCGGEYEIRSFVVPDGDPSPRDFIIRSEEYGVPQRRHRVILLGVHRGISLDGYAPLRQRNRSSVQVAIGLDLPRLRSRLSPLRSDTVDRWLHARAQAFQLAEADGVRLSKAPSVFAGPQRYRTKRPAGPLAEWLRPPGLGKVRQHEPRSHMEQDLVRYAYLANLAQQMRFPTVTEMPDELLPEHENIRSGNTPFVDRFKVQTWKRPSSTVVSHISKDGHYYIHPDPEQMRSLTVREAARLQTFPDDYFFMGPRTKQFHQVGNAVPPLLAYQLAETVAGILGVQ